MTNKRIIIIEENSFFCEILKREFVKKGAFVYVYADALSAVNVLRVNADLFDCVITELNFLEISGIDLISDVRSFDQLMPIILMTKDVPEDINHILEKFRKVTFLRKPFEVDEMLNVASTAIYNNT